MIPVPLLNPKFAIALAARCVRTSGSGHWRRSRPGSRRMWQMSNVVRSLLILLALTMAVPAARAQNGAQDNGREQVDLLLVLAADVSRSVDQPKFQLQREGYAAAIADRRVLEAITA